MRPINVAITGNAPFLAYKQNTSSMTRDAIPFVIERPGKRPIRIWKYARNTRDTIPDIRQVSKDIWGGDRSFYVPYHTDDSAGGEAQKVDFDFICHLGMGIPDERFDIEIRGRRDGYARPDADGNMVDSSGFEAQGLKEEYHSAFDLKRVFDRLRVEFPDLPLGLSDDAKLYFCELRMFSSLAEADLNHPEKRGKVVLFHTWPKYAPGDIELSAKLTTAFIAAVADDPLLATE